MKSFRIPALKQLTDQQVRFAPPAKRLEQLSHAESLLAEIDPNKQYPYQFVCFRITEFRPDSYPDLLISGRDLEHDLCLLIAELSRSMPPVPVETLSEPVMTLEQMSRRLNVSTKTINRWRQQGLIGLPVLCNGRRQVGFLPSLIEPFLNANQIRVDRSGRFSQLTDDEKEQILVSARRLSRIGGCTLTDATRRIARTMNRSPETVRYTIKNYDREHPHDPIFPDNTGVLDPATKALIYRSFRRGMSLDSLAKRFHRTRSSMNRVVNEMRVDRLMQQPIEYVHHPSFDDPSLELEILGDMPDAAKYEEHKARMHAPKDTPAELQSLYEVPLLSKDQEQHLFRKLNFLKYRASKRLEDLKLPNGRVNTRKATVELTEEIERTLEAASDVKEQLIAANMRLVVSIAKRHSGQTDNFFELLSDGNMSLIRAVEKFDFGRGFKFSTYASWAIMKNFARSIPDEKHHRERYVTGSEEVFEAAADARTVEQEYLRTQEQKSTQVNRLLGYLDEREQQIVRMRAGLNEYSEGMTLEEIGQQLGITKERVRQLNVRIMNKLRSIAKEQNID